MNGAAPSAWEGEETMGLLVGLPLMLFRLLFVVLRLAVPVLLILLVIWLVRRGSRGGGNGGGQKPPEEPKFNGPVYTVDYEDVKDDPKDKDP